MLHSPGRGWVLLDFEGEPLRPAGRADGARTSPLRDVAGMLRSFDYAARHATVGLDAQDARALAAQQWAAAAATAFCLGYADVGGRRPAPSTPSCCARSSSTRRCTRWSTRRATGPTWLQIPLGAVRRLLV